MAAENHPLFEDDLDHDTSQEQTQTTPTEDTARLRRGGYSCEFVERPVGGVVLANRISATCPICSLVLREPQQVTCCGSIFCQSCIQDIRSGCPTCKGEFSAFADESVKRSICELTVNCSQRGAGCEWVGKLGELDEHLNIQPLPEKRLEGCQFTEIECKYCMQPFQRRHVQSHQSDSCPKRRFACQYCNKYAATFEEVTQNHWPVCPLVPLSCPNNCKLVFQRQKLEHHMNHDCSLTLVDCDFHKVGCQVRLAQKDLQSHLRDNVVEHMCLQQKLLVQLKNVVTQCRQENEHFQEALDTREEKFQTILAEHQQKLEGVMCTGTLPFNFVMKDFEQHKMASDCWYSPPFYTHTHGYRLCIKVCANGDGSGNKTHVSVYTFLMRGDFDDDLQWPFHGSITIQLLNQLEDRNHHAYAIHFTKTTDHTRISRVMSGERAVNGVGARTFIAHIQLEFSTHRNCRYLVNNQLRFRVLRAININPAASNHKRCLQLECFASAIEPRICTIPIEFTLSNFEERKRKNSMWFSSAFYTHPRGYRMCLKVFPNGWDDGKGTHVSIFICMMQGPFDADLKWPFRGVITIHILNQMRNDDYYQLTIPFNHPKHDTSIGRVTDRKRSAGEGFSQVLPHNTLTPKYLQGNSIRIRISKVKSM